MLFLLRPLIQIASVVHTNIATEGYKLSFDPYGKLVSGPRYGSASLNYNLTTADHISYTSLPWYTSDRSFTAVELQPGLVPSGDCVFGSVTLML